METILKPSEIKILKTQAAVVVKDIATFKIATQVEYDVASSKAGDIKTAYDNVEKQRKMITDPINASLKSINAFFAQFSDPLASSLKSVKDKMNAYKTQELKDEMEARRKIAAKVESGYFKPETGAAKIDAIAVDKTNDNSQARSITKFRVTDITKIPYEYLEVDMVKVKDAMKNGVVIPGVEEYKEVSIVIKKR